MSGEVFPIALSIDRCYVIRGSAPGMGSAAAGGRPPAILIDAGIPWQTGRFARQLARTPVRPADIKLIVLTHGHFDHAGSAAGIAALTGAPVAAHHADLAIATGGQVVLPVARTAYAALMRAVLLRPAMPLFARTSPARVDVLVGDDGLSLEQYGIAGRVVHTPGHTAGSLSVVLANGDAFVGCMSHSGPPFRLSPDLPIFANDMDALLASWQKLLGMGVRRIFPGHGRPFPVAAILAALARARGARGANPPAAAD